MSSEILQQTQSYCVGSIFTEYLCNSVVDPVYKTVDSTVNAVFGIVSSAASNEFSPSPEPIV